MSLCKAELSKSAFSQNISSHLKSWVTFDLIANTLSKQSQHPEQSPRVQRDLSFQWDFSL